MSNLVSIIIPVYNREAYIEECMKSVFGQSFQNYEVIIVDDGSCDNTVNICKQLAEEDSRIKFFEAEHGGVSAARNFALEKATGEYVFFLDSDDFIHPKTLESLVDAFESTDALIGGTGVINIREKNWDKVYEKIKDANTKSEYTYRNFSETLNDFFTYITPINLIGGVMIKRSAIGETLFRTDLFVGEDYYFIYQNLIKGLPAVFLEKSFYYVVKGSQNSSNAYHFDAFWSRFYRRILVWEQEESFGRQAYANKQKLFALHCYLRCMSRNPIKSIDVKKMQKTMRKYKKEILRGLNIKNKAIFYLSVYAPSLYLKIDKFKNKKR